MTERTDEKERIRKIHGQRRHRGVSTAVSKEKHVQRLGTGKKKKRRGGRFFLRSSTGEKKALKQQQNRMKGEQEEITKDHNAMDWGGKRKKNRI